MLKGCVAGWALAILVGASGLADAADAVAPLAAAVKNQDAAAVRLLLRQRVPVDAADAVNGRR